MCATVASEGTLVSTECAQTGCSEGVLTPKLKAIYFFAGKKRKGDIETHLHDEFQSRNWTLSLIEFDIETGGAANARSLKG